MSTRFLGKGSYLGVMHRGSLNLHKQHACDRSDTSDTFDLSILESGYGKEKKISWSVWLGNFDADEDPAGSPVRLVRSPTT